MQVLREVHRIKICLRLKGVCEFCEIDPPTAGLEFSSVDTLLFGDGVPAYFR